MKKPPPIVRSLDLGLQMLLMLNEHESVTVTQVAQELDISRSTAHRGLSTLQGRGIVTLSPSGSGYQAGPTLLEFIRPRSLDPGFRAAVQPYLERLANATRETVHTAVLLGAQVLLVNGQTPSSLPSRSDRVALRAGMIRPAHTLSAGKLLLSRLNNEQVIELFPSEELFALSSHTLRTRRALIAELDRIRQAGYAINRGEFDPRFAGVSVLLPGLTWRDQVSVMLSLPISSGSDAKLHDLADQMRAVISSFSARGPDDDVSDHRG
ncbi:IclR family transcriptional regulator [Rhodococcus baikonurensis]|jgi:IclR family acetate operon transcriptional repressor|uniref:IclR family transcriptional regulator n=2 Tax=Rhodococcus baikonurensis TaxID=172041 RepID=A0ABV5XKZ7_9NOCA